MNTELLLFFRSVCLGAVLLLCYDILVVLRRIIPHRREIASVQDILFWILAGFVFFAGAYRGTAGKLRNFLFLGSFVGFWLCRETISPLFVAVLVKIFRIPAFLVKNTVKRLIFPVKRCKIFKKNDAPLNKRFEQIEKSRKKE